VLNGDATLHAGQMLGVFGQHFGAGNFNPAQMATMALQQNGGMNAQDPKLEDGGEDTKKRKKRAYKARDPNAPKRPLTAYFRYLGEVRHSISEELQKNPENFKDVAGQPGDISRIATARWQQMSEDAKAPYKAAYRSELEDYNVKAAQYAKRKGLPVADGAELGDGEGDATGFTEADAPGEDVAEDAKAAAEKDDDDDDTSSEDSSSEDSDEDEPAPAPVKAPTTKKSAMKKNKTPAQPQTFNSLPTPVFNSINPNPPAASSSSSPTRKRKGSGEEAESSKKRNRKSKGDAVAGSDPAPVAPMAASSPEVQAPAAEAKKKKKDKKKSKGSDA
jgi:transcriptional regulator HMO1